MNSLHWLLLTTLLGWAIPMAGGAAESGVAFDDGWRFARGDVKDAQQINFDDQPWQAVDLPHDWAIAGPIAANNPTGSSGGFFPAGVGWYRKTFDAPAAWAGHPVSIEFDGVYMRSEVWLNGQSVGKHAYGFTPFALDLTPYLQPGKPNTLAVRVDNSRQPNCRWYSGSGINRHVRLAVQNPVHITQRGVFIWTESLSPNAAQLAMSIQALNTDAKTQPTIHYATSLYETSTDGQRVGQPVAQFEPAQGEFAPDHERLISTVQARATLAQPKLWTPDHPTLYLAVTTATVDGRVVDTRETTIGVRSVTASADKGFLLNGQPLKLYGACIHDDNGPLGTAAFDRAEVRRAQQLKDAGFNAVRCAHNPPAPAFLDACDRIGLLVIDEIFDSWAYGKLGQDYSRDFAENWEADLDSMILRDRNHPSIIMWSLGNEIHDFGSGQGLTNGTKIAERVRSLDRTRFLNSAVFWYAQIGGPLHWTWEQADELMSKLDIVGYNYQIFRYQADHQRKPDRVIVATESYTRDLFISWQSVNDNTYVLGDFVWTGIDYLGESGIGRSYASGQREIFHATQEQYPYHGAYCGDIDLTGFRKPVSHDRNIVWDKGEKLYAAVLEPGPDGKPMHTGPWGIIPSRAIWDWPGMEGKALQVEVYSQYDSVRLYLNDQLIGEKPTTRKEKFVARFEVPYSPGTLRAAGVRDGAEVEQHILQTTGPVAQLRLTPDRPTIHADNQDLSYVVVESLDAQGRLQPTGDQVVKVSLDGPGKILGITNGDFREPYDYTGQSCRLFQGRAMVVIRSSHESGRVTVKASCQGMSDVTTTVKSQ